MSADDIAREMQAWRLAVGRPRARQEFAEQLNAAGFGLEDVSRVLEFYADNGGGFADWRGVVWKLLANHEDLRAVLADLRSPSRRARDRIPDHYCVSDGIPGTCVHGRRASERCEECEGAR